jgi:hypothetical protein
MGSFKQFCQQEPLEEGLVSAVKKIFSPKKKNVSSRPQTAVGKKDAYRTHDDIDPDDIPVFKPSFNVRKEEEIQEGNPLTSRKIKKASASSSKSGKFAKVDYYTKKNDDKNIQYTSKKFRKEDEGLTKQMKAKGYSGPKVGDDRHLTFTKKNDKNNQVLVDIPGKEWHAMKDGIVTKVGSFKSFRKDVKEGRARIDSSKAESGINRKVRKSLKKNNWAKWEHNFKRSSERREKSK